MGFYAAGDTGYTVFTLTDADGAASDADSLPTAAVYLNGVANGASVTVTDLGTGLYSATWTNPGANGNTVSVVASFTMDGITSHATIWESRLSAQPYSGTPPTPPSTSDIKTALEASGSHLDLILTAVTAIKTQTDKFANITQAHWQRMRAALIGTKTKNAAGTSSSLKDVDGSTVDTETA